MRKLALVFAALVLCALPAAAQQSPDATAPTPVVEAAPAPQATPAAPAADPAAALYVSPTEVREQLRQSESRRANTERLERAAMGQRDFLIIAGAVAVGVILAALLLD
jgi:hypothetical protein